MKKVFQIFGKNWSVRKEDVFFFLFNALIIFVKTMAVHLWQNSITRTIGKYIWIKRTLEENITKDGNRKKF